MTFALFALQLEQSDGDEVRTKMEIDPAESMEIDGSSCKVKANEGSYTFVLLLPCFLLPGSKGEANLVFKFEGARKQAYVKIVDVKGITTGGVWNG